MKRNRFPLYAVLVLLLSSCARATPVFFNSGGSVIELADSSTAAAMNIRPDDYTREHTPYDLMIRLGETPGLSEKTYLDAAAKSVHNWSDREQEALKKAFASIDQFVKSNHLHLHLPDTVVMIKTDAREEFQADGYTRMNRIMLNTGIGMPDLHIVAHELFHVMSRYNEKMRNDAYAVFHFMPCNNVVYKPALNDHVITNPDCPWIRHCIIVTVDGKQQEVALILYSKSDYTPGYTLDDYAAVGLLALTRNKNGNEVPLLKNGEPVIYDLNEIPDFITQVGMNTSYMLHVEEICAEHFAALVEGKQLPDMSYVAGLRKALEH